MSSINNPSLFCVTFRKQLKQGQSSSSFPTLSRRGERSTLGSGENRFIFKRRLFRANHLRELSQDPVEINMLYAQAVYHVVKVSIILYFS